MLNCDAGAVSGKIEATGIARESLRVLLTVLKPTEGEVHTFLVCVMPALQTNAKDR